jgi:hypothetical protein
MGTKFRSTVLLLALGIWSPPVLAGEAIVSGDGSATWQAGVDGVEIEWNADGSVKRLYSRYSTPVEFADRRGIATAQIIAEEKAKAGIVRFIQQSVASTRVVAEVESDLNKAIQERSSGTPSTVHKSDERTLIESLTEVTASFAAGTLRGVIVLEKGYDDKAQEAWVVVGISEKTLNAASSVKHMIDEPKSPTTPGSDSIGTQPSEVRRSNQKDF